MFSIPLSYLQVSIPGASSRQSGFTRSMTFLCAIYVMPRLNGCTTMGVRGSGKDYQASSVCLDGTISGQNARSSCSEQLLDIHISQLTGIHLRQMTWRAATFTTYCLESIMHVIHRMEHSLKYRAYSHVIYSINLPKLPRKYQALCIMHHGPLIRLHFKTSGDCKYERG